MVLAVHPAAAAMCECCSGLVPPVHWGAPWHSAALNLKVRRAAQQRLETARITQLVVDKSTGSEREALS
eukprot:5035238-Prymnesium_polylepis.1